MIFRWVNHEELTYDVKILLVLAEMLYASERQLCLIMGWNRSKLHNTFTKIKKRAKTKKERKEWIKNIRTDYPLDKSCYALGREGVNFINSAFQCDIRYKNIEYREAQTAHELGLNDICIRLIEKQLSGANLNIEWYNTKEAKQILYRMCSIQKPDIDEKEMIKPDAYLMINQHGFWIEYDNTTEGTRVIEEKLLDYVRYLKPLANPWIDQYGKRQKPLHKAPVIWVTPDIKRRDYLERIWKQLVYLRFRDEYVPNMFFFLAGEDTQFFLDKIKIKNH